MVAASRYLGRANLAAALRSFEAEGVWGTSPHLIPHFALHSPVRDDQPGSGDCTGRTWGSAAGCMPIAEGFLAALTWLSAGVVPGVWLVLSGWSPELIPDQRGGAASHCRTNARPWPWRLWPRESPGERPAFRVVIGGESATPRPRSTWFGWPRAQATRASPSPRTIATDPRGRLRVELVEGAEGPG